MIANALGITEATVKVHLKSLLRKINVTNRIQAAVWAFNNGIATSEMGERGRRSPGSEIAPGLIGPLPVGAKAVRPTREPRTP